MGMPMSSTSVEYNLRALPILLGFTRSILESTPNGLRLEDGIRLTRIPSTRMVSKAARRGGGKGSHGSQSQFPMGPPRNGKYRMHLLGISKLSHPPYSDHPAKRHPI